MPDKDIFAELDHASVPSAWWPDLSDTLLQLGASIDPVNRPILAPLVTYLARHSLALRAHAGKVAPVEPPKEIHASNPGSATLFRYRHGRSAGLELLTSIGLCALLEASEEGRGPPKRLLSVVRGALDTPQSPLSGVLGAISSIPELIRIVDADELTRNGLPRNFMQLWDAWLRGTLVRWMLAEPGRLRQALEPQALSPQPEDPQIPVSVEPGTVEGGIALSGKYVPASDGDPRATTSCRVARAASDQLDRASIGDLMAPADLHLPRSIDERLCRSAVSQATRHLDQDPVRAEPFVALALLLGGGVREIDLREVVWGGEGAARPHSIDPAAPILYRRLKRPANAVQPSKELAGWLEPAADVMAWPLPVSVHALLLKLGEAACPGQAVLPLLGASLAPPYRLHDVVAHILPEAKVGALAPRQALASEIAAALGTEMAQIAMADTFGMPSVPAYYSSLPEADLAGHIAEIQSRRFGERVVAPPGRHGYVGSRLVLTDLAAKRWPGLLRDAIKLASRQSDDWSGQWRTHRDHLVGALCSATGHRPEDALGKIFLGDVIPEYGLIILQDKQVDALRATRIAATGRLWLSDLRRYLDRLLAISSQRRGKPEGELAAAILRNEASLFSHPAPDGTVAPMTAAALRDGMPPELQSVDNFFRHRLNQRLLERRVDPEIRHAQLGWVVSAAHFHADLSPRSPVNLGAHLGPVIDDLLVADGWYLPTARKTRWTWGGVPLPPPVDWNAAFKSQKCQHDEELKRIRLRLSERWKELEGPVLLRLGDAFRQFCPLLRVNPENKTLVHVVGGGAVDLGPDHHALICDRVRQGDLDPSSGLEAVMARILLYRLVRRARDMGIVRGPIPGRPYLAITSDPSPFVPGLGMAVRHAHLVRQALQARASAGSVRDLGQLTVWSILAFSMYRRMPWAQAATGAARTALRARKRSHVIRIAAQIKEGRMHMVFGGAPATLLVRRKRMAPTSPPPSLQTLEDWAMEHLSPDLDWGGSKAAAARIEATLAAAARLELSGIERVLLQAGAQTAAEAPARCVAHDDGWAVHTVDHRPTGKSRSTGEPPLAEVEPKAAQRDQRSDYNRLVGLLNKRSFGRLRAAKTTKGKRASDSNRGWQHALGKELASLREQVGPDSNLSVLIGYALDHLRYGSEDGNRLSQNSLRREITQFGWPLLMLLAEQSLLGLSADELLRVYRAVLLSKSTESRPYAAEELQRFHRFLMRVHACPAVDMAELAAIAGTRGLGIEPGLLTEAERRIVLEELRRDSQNEAVRPDASPEFLRLTQLRQVFYLVLEAAGIRPGSTYGLTLGDVHFLRGMGDFVHVRTGDYGEAKTSTSLGFVPLTGTLWKDNREWIQEWIRDQRVVQPDGWQDVPLFAVKPGHRTRVHEHQLSNRVNTLLKWASGNREAHGYWLRKTRISERFQLLSRVENVSARHVHGMLAASGHAWIQVTVERYINDPASLLFADLKAAEEAPRALLLSVAGLDAGPLDAAWHRAGGGGSMRLSVVLDRVGAQQLLPPPEQRVPAPALNRFKALQPMHVDAYARALQKRRDQAEAALEAGITRQQAGDLDAAASELFVRRGQAPWNIESQGGARHIMPPPRRLAGTEKWFALLDQHPSCGLKAITDSWVAQSHVERVHGRDFIMRVEQGLLPAVQELLSETGLKLQVVSSGGHHLLRERPIAEGEKGHGAAFRWVLSILWVYESALDHPS